MSVFHQILKEFFKTAKKSDSKNLKKTLEDIETTLKTNKTVQQTTASIATLSSSVEDSMAFRKANTTKEQALKEFLTSIDELVEDPVNNWIEDLFSTDEEKRATAFLKLKDNNIYTENSLSLFEEKLLTDQKRSAYDFANQMKDLKIF